MEDLVPAGQIAFIFFLSVFIPISFLLTVFQSKQGITNTPALPKDKALPIDKMLYIYLLCPHSEYQKKSGLI
jgi:preprotein translocase subunit SecY